MTAIQQIPIQSIATPPWNTRAADSDLVASVKLHGILSPICLLDTGPKEFRVVYGSRRLDAARKAGLATVPAIVHEKLTSTDERILCLVENLHRSAADPIQEGRIFKELLALGLGVLEVAKRCSKHPNYVRARVRIAGLDPAILAQLAENSFDPRAAALLALLPPEAAGRIIDALPHLLTSPDDLRDHLVRSAPSLQDAPFPADDASADDSPDCSSCPHRLDGACLDSDCFTKKATSAISRALARLRADGPGDAPPVASAEPVDEVGSEIFKRLGVEILKRERIAGDDERGGRHAILLDGLKPRLVRLAPSNRPKDGRALRHNDQRRQAQVRASFVARAAGELLAQRIAAPSEPDPISATQFLIAIAAAASGETVASLAHAQRVLLRLLLFRVRRNLYLGESISGIDPDKLRTTARAVLSCLDPEPDATLARLDEQAETALKA